MSATPRNIPIEEGDLGGSYASIAVDEDHIATLTDVTDHVTTNTSGWMFHYEIDGLPFKTYAADTKAARWKTIQIIEAFDPGFFANGGSLVEVDPNLFIGQAVGAHVVYSVPDEEWDKKEARYKEIKYTFPLPAEAVDTILDTLSMDDVLSL